MRNDENFSLACKLLGRRSMSLRELASALVAKGLSPEAAEETCRQVKQMRLADDLEYARTLVRRYTARMQGKNAIQVRLRAHGIDSDDIEAALSDWEPDFERLTQLLVARYGLDADYATIQRASGLLYRRGFSHDEIKTAIALYSQITEASDDDMGFDAFPDDD